MDTIFKNPTVSQNIDFIKANAVKYGLSVEESALIYSYTTPDYYLIINRANRGEIEMDTLISEYTRALNSALDKLPNYNETVYKGMDIKFPDSELKTILQALILDDLYEVKGFYSTSKNLNIADLRWKGKEVKVIFTIKSKTGKDIEKLAWINPITKENLEEVLFKHPSKYKVKKYTLDKSTKIYNILLEEN